MIIILFFLPLVLYGCWFSEVVKKSSKFDSISSLIWSYTKRQLLKVKMYFIFIIFEFLNKGFTGSFFHLKLRIQVVFSWIFQYPLLLGSCFVPKLEFHIWELNQKLENKSLVLHSILVRPLLLLNLLLIWLIWYLVCFTGSIFWPLTLKLSFFEIVLFLGWRRIISVLFELSEIRFALSHCAICA